MRGWYRNDGSDTFADSGLTEYQVDNCGFAWGDFDGDGDLDAALAGRDKSFILINVVATANTVPGAPAPVGSSYVPGEITLSWSDAADAETQPYGLTYNVRIGTSSGDDDVLAPMADLSTGLRRIAAMGNAQTSTSRSVTGLAPGTYYWSVQSVDSAFAGSPWATEQQVVLPGVTVTYPNGGETVSVGGTCVITWTASSLTDVRLRYSTTNGSSWADIATVDDASPSWLAYSWTVPNDPSTQCLIRIENSGDASMYDQSDAAFTIEPGSIALTSGDGQVALAGTTLAQPFIVTVTDGSAQPLQGIDVTFAVTAGGGTLSNAQPQQTNASGEAQTYLTLGSSAGTNTVTASVSGFTGSPVTLTATAYESLDITTTALPSGEIGAAYSTTLAATGGYGVLTWACTAGDLSTYGLALNAGTGEIYGTPTLAVSSQSFTFEVTDTIPNSDTETVTLTIDDTTPPGAIADLAASYSGVDDTVALEWTATGDNGTVGTATSYVLKTSASLIDAGNFDAATTVSQGWTPVASGGPESHSVSLIWYTGTHYFAIKAQDAVPNDGPISNVIAVDTDAHGNLPAAMHGYGSVPFNSTASHDFVVTNTSALVDVVISAVSVTGDAEFTVTAGNTGLPVSIAAGGCHTVTVQFGPTAATSYSGTLSITHNVSGSTSPHEVGLSGTGTNEDPSIASANGAPNPVAANSSTTLTVQVTDGNNSLPSINDISSVTIDLSSVGGSASQAMTYSSNTDATTAVFTHALDTSGLAYGVYEFGVTATDAAGATATDDLVLYVYTGSLIQVPASYSSIQLGINAASNGDAVVVSDGVYTGAGNVNLHTDGKAIMVVSANGAGLTTIDCEGSGRGFNFNSTGETTSTVVSGFTFTNASSGGVRCFGNCEVLIRDCVFYQNDATSYGGAVQLDGNTNDHCEPTFLNCVFDDNTSFRGGAIHTDKKAAVVLIDCTFSNNETTNYGGGLCINDSPYQHTIAGCVFLSNQAGMRGGAIDFRGLDNGVAPQVTRCLFLGNSSDRGGALHFYVAMVDVSVTECGFFGNSATNDHGGAIYLSRDVRTIDLTGCTFAGNAASHRGGAIYETSYNSTLVLKNCIVWNNSAGIEADELFFNGDSDVQITYSDIDSSAGSIKDDSVSINGGNGFLPGADGNISSDPLFVTGPRGDYYLSHTAAGQASDSPCIDAGSDTATSLGVDDRTTRTDGVPDSGTADMGYHYAP